VRAVLAGVGGAEALADPGETRVLASFPRAVYVATPAGIAALVGPGVAPGPLHILLDAPPSAAVPRVELAGVPAWRGELPGRERLAAALPLILDLLAPVAAGNLVPVHRAKAALLALRSGNLVEVADLLGGAGPGLTPAGDDALGGILFGLRAMGQDGDLLAVGRRVQTTAISAAFLMWAARGQALSPVHDLLAAAAAGDVPAARSAARALRSVGHSSGADFAQGVCWGLTEAPRTT
jgi:hypothetical protein